MILVQNRQLPEQEAAAVPVSPVNPYAGFDPHAGANWMYPMDYATPEYHSLITEKALVDHLAVSFREDVCRNFIGNQIKACEGLMRLQPADVMEMVMKPHERHSFCITKRMIISSYMMVCDLTSADSDDGQN